MRARFTAGDEVVLEQWTQFLGRLTVDRCRVEFAASEPPWGTVLTCRFFVPAARQAAKILIGACMLALGLGLAIGILSDARASIGARVAFLLFGGAMAVAGVLGISSVRPRARRGQQYVLSWLAQVVTARPA